MQTDKKLAIWMDHASAHIFEYPPDSAMNRTVASTFTLGEKRESLEKSESIMHNKENHDRAGYYKELSGIIQSYDTVLLFGPTQAKSELHNLLKADHRFDKITIKTSTAEKMSEHAMEEFVKTFFTQPINL